MHRIQSRTLAIVGLVLLLGSGLSWAGPPPNIITSDLVLDNTAGGSFALSFNGPQASFNTAFGLATLWTNNGNSNTAFGGWALSNNTTGSFNTAIGEEALFNNTTGVGNTASGQNALQRNTTGGGNTATGTSALYFNTTGVSNTATGPFALYSNTTGYYNTATGTRALYFNTTGASNTAHGLSAGAGNTTGTYNTFIGYEANTNAGIYTNGTALGSGALLTASNSIVLGNTAIRKIYAKVSTITAISDRRRKKDIRALDSDLGLDFIEKLKPVSFRFNDGDETERYGFIAQDLEQALPAPLHNTIRRSEPEHGLALIERQNDKDRTYRISYGELFAPIVKSIQQQQQEIAAERQQNADLRRALEEQTAAFKAENDALRHAIKALREQVSAAR